MTNAEAAQSNPGPDRVVVSRAWFDLQVREEESRAAYERVTSMSTLPSGVVLWATDHTGARFRAVGMSNAHALAEVARILRDRRTQAQGHARSAA